MTSLFGSPHERWPLSRAVDAMVASARRAGFPGLLWAVGLVYPSLGLGLGVVREILDLLGQATGVSFDILPHWATEPILSPTLAPGPGTLLTLNNPTEAAVFIAKLFVLLPLVLVLSRLIGGLAALSEDARWREACAGRRTPGLRAAWRAGAGLALSAFGLFLTFPLLFFGAVVFLLGPVVVLINLVELLQSLTSLLAIFLMPIGLVVMSYGVVLQVLIQLALHSLARNRRGYASALTHAWRLVRNSPWSTARGALVDLVLQGAMLVLTGLVEQVLQTPGLILAWTLWSFVGVMRAGYWARTYDGLGGLSTVPGSVRLESAQA